MSDEKKFIFDFSVNNENDLDFFFILLEAYVRKHTFILHHKFKFTQRKIEALALLHRKQIFQILRNNHFCTRDRLQKIFLNYGFGFEGKVYSNFFDKEFYMQEVKSAKNVFPKFEQVLMEEGWDFLS